MITENGEWQINVNDKQWEMTMCMPDNEEWQIMVRTMRNDRQWEIAHNRDWYTMRNEGMTGNSNSTIGMTDNEVRDNREW